jgi:uncharacterized RDD family membrane protein YckC
MNSKYCQSCGNKVMNTMRMCPSCGGKDFDSAYKNNNQASNNQTNNIQQSYTAPASATNSNNFNQTFAQATKIAPAPLVQRLVASIIDVMIVAVLQLIPITLAYILTLPLRQDEINPIRVIGILAAVMVPFIYYTILPSSDIRATYGKKIMGLKLVTLQGEKINKPQAFTRVLLTMLIPITGIIMATLSIGGMTSNLNSAFESSAIIAYVILIPIILWGPYLTIYFNPLKQTLYDMIAKTIVIKE